MLLSTPIEKPVKELPNEFAVVGKVGAETLKRFR